MAATPAVQRAKEQTFVQQKTRSKSLLDQMDAVFNEISRRAFQLFEDNGRVFGNDLEDWFRAEREMFRPLYTKLTESDESLKIKAEVPGFTEKELEISVQPRRIVIAGEHESTGKEIDKLLSEQVLQIVDLPAEVETDKVTATLKNGVLILVMPKAAKARSVRIKPTAG